jgi:hypothetical protein
MLGAKSSLVRALVPPPYANYEVSPMTHRWHGLVVLCLGLGAAACSKTSGGESEAQPSAVVPKEDPAAAEAAAFVAALRADYPVARQAEQVFNEGEACAQGEKWDRSGPVLQFSETWDKCTTACEQRQGCLDKCYVKAGGKGSAKEREACWSGMPAAMAKLQAAMPAASNGCPAQARKAVADALDEASHQAVDATGFMKPFPWGTLHDGLNACAQKLFRCGKMTKEPCKGAAVANFLGLREKAMPSDATFRNAAGRRGSDLFLASGTPANL